MPVYEVSRLNAIPFIVFLLLGLYFLMNLLLAVIYNNYRDNLKVSLPFQPGRANTLPPSTLRRLK